MKTYRAAFLGCGNMTEAFVDNTLNDPTIVCAVFGRYFSAIDNINKRTFLVTMLRRS